MGRGCRTSIPTFLFIALLPYFAIYHDFMIHLCFHDDLCSNHFGFLPINHITTMNSMPCNCGGVIIAVKRLDIMNSMPCNCRGVIIAVKRLDIMNSMPCNCRGVIIAVKRLDILVFFHSMAQCPPRLPYIDFVSCPTVSCPTWYLINHSILLMLWCFWVY